MKPPATRRGLTLIELMITVAILGIIAALAWGSARMLTGIGTSGYYAERAERARNALVEASELTRAMGDDALRVFVDAGPHGLNVGDPAVTIERELQSIEEEELVRVRLTASWRSLDGTRSRELAYVRVLTGEVHQ